MSFETHVVVEEQKEYKGGIGYVGHVLKVLGFPSGPYIKGVANLLVRQAKTVDKKLKLKVVEYLPE